MLNNMISKGYKVMTICSFITIVFLLATVIYLIKEIRTTQVETSAKIDFINSYCLE